MNENAAYAIIRATMFSSCAACGVGDDYARAARQGSIEITCPDGVIVRMESQGLSAEGMKATNACESNVTPLEPRR